MAESWYETVSAETRLTQGDLISDCPLFFWTADFPELEGMKEVEVLSGLMDFAQQDVVVMTQACDLEHDKVDNVVLCPHYSLADFREAWGQNMEARRQNSTEKAWRNHCEDIKEGFVWNLAMLDSGRLLHLPLEIRIVDFREVYTVPRGFLESLIRQRGEPRSRLLPPFREHLSQAFARFFMRVGLPVPIEGTW